MFKTSHEKQQLFLEVVLDLLEGINTPYALNCALRLRSKVYGFLPVNPNDYDDPQMYLLDAQANALFKKSPYLTSSDDLASYAQKLFFVNEEKCRQSNHRLTTIRNEENLQFNRMLSTARDFIMSIIGQSPEGLTAFRFGPGATTALSSHTATLINKVAKMPEVCSVALNQLQELTKGTLYEQTTQSKDFKIIRNHNIFTSVPKDSRGNRGIAIEPDGNMVVQLSLGNQLRKRLRLSGYDLDILSNHHRYFAERASLYGDFATIDLSSASDCICSHLVKLLLPTDWWVALNRARSHQTLIGDSIHHNEKFSSMGNGFTFELESLIFLSICHAASIEYDKPKRGMFHWSLHLPDPITGALTKQRFSAKREFYSVFGDDIICLTEHADLIINMLEFCGLTTNKEKTFLQGPFRESCGADFFNGVDVRPLYIKDLPDGLEGLYQLYNTVERISIKLYGSVGWFQRPLKRILFLLKGHPILFGPIVLSNNWLVSDDPKSFSYSRKMRKRLISQIRCLMFKPKIWRVNHAPYPGDDFSVDTTADSGNLLLYALLGGESTGYTKRNAPRCMSFGSLPSW